MAGGLGGVEVRRNCGSKIEPRYYATNRRGTRRSGKFTHAAARAGTSLVWTGKDGTKTIS